jgi:hypothetical protein
LPVTPEISGLTGSKDKRALYNFDLNDNSAFDGCSIDECDASAAAGELPVLVDWNSTGTEKLALFLPKYSTSYLDPDENGSWNGCRKDKCLGRCGAKGIYRLSATGMAREALELVSSDQAQECGIWT